MFWLACKRRLQKWWVFVGVWREWAPSAGAARPFASCSHSSDSSFSSFSLFLLLWWLFLLLLRSLSRCPASCVQSESHECSGEATKGFLGCVRFPYCNLKMRSLIYWLTSRQICSWSRVANKIQWLSLWFSLYERNTEQLQVKMQTPPACCSPPSSIFHISFFLHFSSSVDGCSTWCTSPFWNMSLIEKTTSREMFALRTCTHSLIIQNWQTLCFPSYSKGNCSAEYSTEHSAVKIPVVRPLCWALTRE